MKLPSSLTLPSARQCALDLAQDLLALPPGGTFSVDASPLVELDTSALAVLLQARRDALARGLAWQLLDAPAKLRLLASLYGVDVLLWPSAEPAGST
jgi:phospholipid transport system transporter-binding protein